MKSNTEQFIEKARKVHGDKYNYNLVDYINNHSKIIIVCSVHGSFSQIPSNHLSGAACRKCANTTTTEEFLEKIKKIHGDYYDYSNTIYKRSSENIEIICKQHGLFIQKAQTHLRGANCPECAKLNRTQKRTITTNQFIEKAKSIHCSLYGYDKTVYKGNRIYVEIFCKTHGYFKQTPNSHISGHGCPLCGNINSTKVKKTTEQFIKDASLIHDNKYLYDLLDYKKGVVKVDIICKTHGVFKQTPNNHLRGQGCKKCASESNMGGFGRTDYIKRANEKICTFYTIRCFNETEEFYKIGITMNTVKKRYESTRTMPYAYEIISEIFGEAGFIWDLELEEKKRLKEFHYTPNISFKGSVTECFSRLIE